GTHRPASLCGQAAGSVDGQTTLRPPCATRAGGGRSRRSGRAVYGAVAPGQPGAPVGTGGPADADGHPGRTRALASPSDVPGAAGYVVGAGASSGRPGRRVLDCATGTNGSPLRPRQ